jgi:hypothetical protein
MCKRRSALLVVTLALSLAMLLSAGIGMSSAAPIRECGRWTAQAAYNITTRKVSCRKARSVVRRWGQTAARERDGDGAVFGFFCNYRNIGYEAGDIRCTAPRGRVVHWQTGV